MKIKRLLCMGIMAAILLLTACSGTTKNGSADGGGSTAAVTSASTAVPVEKDNFNPEGYPIVDEKITLTALQYCRDSDNIDFQNLPFFQSLEEKTNIHINFEVVKEADWKTKLNLMFASGQYTDLILRGTVDDDEYGASQGILIPLDGLIETYMPNYWERLQMNDANASIPASDGKTYYIGYLVAQNINTNEHMFINKTWLKNLNLKVPTTIDELTDVFRKFKNSDPNRNGQKDEIPYESTFGTLTTGIYPAFASWGIPENRNFVMIDDNDKVLVTVKQDGYRQCLEWLNKIYTEGLIDPECISQDGTVFSAKLTAKTCGYFGQWRITAMGLDEIVDDYECMLPVAAEGYSPKLPRILELPALGAALTKSNKYVKESLRWLDAQMETETMMSSVNGILDKDFKLNENGKYEVIGVPNADELNKYVPGVNGQFFAPGSYYFNVYEMASHRVEKAEYCKWYNDSGVLENKSYMYLTNLCSMTTGEKAELERLKTEIVKYMDENITNFITTGVTDAKWNDFISKLDGLKIDDYVKLYQTAYDKYLAANR